MSYVKHHIAKLSPQQISKVLNGHAIRMEGGGHHVVNLSIEQSKKLHRAHMHGKAVSIRFDPFQIHHHQHLRGGATLRDIGSNFYDRKIPDELKPGMESLGQSALGMAGFGLRKRGRPKKLKGGATLKDQANNFYDRKIPDELKPGLESLGQSALGMAGFGLKRGRPRKHKTTGKGFFDDMASGFRSIGNDMTETIFKPMARDAIDYGVPAAVGALTTMSGNPEFAPITSYAASKATPSIKKSVGLGLKKPKRVMSEKQKEALAKGRHALRLHLNAVGAGTKKRMRGKAKSGGALLAAGY